MKIKTYCTSAGSWSGGSDQDYCLNRAGAIAHKAGDEAHSQALCLFCVDRIQLSQLQKFGLEIEFINPNLMSFL